MFYTAKQKQVLHVTWPRAWIPVAISLCHRSSVKCCQQWCWGVSSYSQEHKGTCFPKGPNPAHPTVCAAWWELVGQLSPSFSFPLTSVFLFTYLLPPHLMQTLISTSCVLVQWSDLPEATWQDMNSPGSPPASCSLLIRRRYAEVLVAGLSIPTLFPTSHASFPLPQATAIARCGGLRNMYTTTQDAILGNVWGGRMGEWDRTRGQGLSTFLGNKQS